MNKRWIAYKLNVNDVANGKYTDDGFIEHGNLQVNRVRILGTIVQKFVSDDDKYGFFILDDGTETIRIRSFQDTVDLIKSAEIGEMVDVFGRIRKYEDEIYVIPEIVKKIEDPNFWILRKIELKKQEEKLGIRKEEKKQEAKSGEVDVEEDVIEEVIDKPSPKEQTTLGESVSPRKKVIDSIAEFDEGEGVEVDHLIEKCGLETGIVENVLTDLMNEGEIFEPRAGKVKILG